MINPHRTNPPGVVQPLAQREVAAGGGRGGLIPGAVAPLAAQEGMVGLVGRKGGSVGVLGEGGDMEQGGGERRGVDTAHRWGRKVETGLPLHHERQMS